MAANALTSIVAVVIVLGIMILVHEWGHFMAAKLFGVRVEVFSFGLGPRLWGRRRGATDYRISALPVGGYVRMAGDNPAEERKGEPDEFLSKPRWQRAIIALAGPAMNIVMSVVLLAGIFAFVGLGYPAYFSRPARISAVPRNSLAAGLGIRPGDRIAELNGTKDPTWEQVYTLFSQALPGTELHAVLQRDAEELSLNVPVTEPRELERVLGYVAIPPVIDEIVPGLPAERAGLKSDDEILALNGQPIVTWPQLVEGIKQSAGQPVQLLVRRGDRQLHLQVRPMHGQNARGEPVWQIGIAPREELSYKRMGPVSAVEQAVLANLAGARAILGVVGQLFTGKVSVRQLQGVVGIARESGQAVKRGPLRLIHLMAVISLNLAILNLLPIPILDGGHILLLAIEGSLRRDLSVAVKERFVQVGLVFLLAIIAFAMYNDVLRLLPNH